MTERGGTKSPNDQRYILGGDRSLRELGGVNFSALRTYPRSSIQPPPRIYHWRCIHRWQIFESDLIDEARVPRCAGKN